MKTMFMTRNPREKVLVLLMLVVGLVIWGSFFAERLGAMMADRHRLNNIHSEFKVYLDNQGLIRDRVEQGTRNLDPSRTLDATRLWGEVGALARQHGLNPSVGSPRTEPGDVFSYHTLVLSVSEADLGSLINFTGELQARAPYMALEEVTITPRPNPTLLNVTYRISSVELNP